MLKVLVADALPVFRIGIKEILIEEFSFVYFDEVSDDSSLAEKIKTEKWDIIIIDSVISDDNKEIMNQILHLDSKPHILILSSDPAVQFTRGVISEIGFLSKKATVVQFLKAVQGILTDQGFGATNVANLHRGF